MIAARLADLDAAEADANDHVGAWREGRPTPLAAVLGAFRDQWLSLSPGEELDLVFTPAARSGRR